MTLNKMNCNTGTSPRARAHLLADVRLSVSGSRDACCWSNTVVYSRLNFARAGAEYSGRIIANLAVQHVRCREHRGRA
jgi:hypothetical protein